ncbi:hypothetical protein M0Q97_07725 [Candidatus Dojkabacteria bacterium]|jgi:hypothetical protein|nr:hypothetical protein [Candidatus Dojkabacteria bacterium]
MKTLVIHPRDTTTDFLSDIYKDKDWTVITENISKSQLKLKIIHHDRIVMLGHGNKDGLYYFKHNRFIVSSELVYLLRSKICVGIWCNADKFFEKYKLSGFNTGMIISEIDEAYQYGVRGSFDIIEQSNKLFAYAIKESIDLTNIVDNVKQIYVGDNEIISFNKNNLYLKK